jgi:hypothetical protein
VLSGYAARDSGFAGTASAADPVHMPEPGTQRGSLFL